jgi:hypothetical protein
MKIQVKTIANKCIFFLYAALNACGYDQENRLAMHPVRVKTREWVSAHNPDIGELRAMVEAQQPKHWYLLIHELLGDSATERVTGFGEALDKFVQTTELEKLWQEVLPEYEVVVTQVQADGVTAAAEVERYLRMVELGVDELIIIPNLLDKYYSGIGPKIGRTAYAILGPSEDGINPPRIQHELLHSIINPLTEDENPEKRSRLREYLIRAMILRLNVEDAKYYTSRRAKHLVQGYKFLDAFLSWLDRFERSERPFDMYLKETKTELEPMVD